MGVPEQLRKFLPRRTSIVLPGGTIERYLPAFTGNPLDPKSPAKQNAVVAELKELQRIRQSDENVQEKALLDRYGDLFEVVRKLPSRAQIDFDGGLRQHLSDYVHELQKVVEANPDWELERVEHKMRRPAAAEEWRCFTGKVPSACERSIRGDDRAYPICSVRVVGM